MKIESKLRCGDKNDISIGNRPINIIGVKFSIFSLSNFEPIFDLFNRNKPIIDLFIRNKPIKVINKQGACLQSGQRRGSA